VIGVEESGRRIRLARKGVEIRPPQRPQVAASRPAPRKRVKAAVKREAPPPAAPPSVRSAFGSILADKLKAALDQPGSS
jgi:hypothetical protein